MSFLLVNLGFTIPIKLYSSYKKIAIKFYIINIRQGTMLCGGRFYQEKIVNFSPLMCKQY